MNKVNDRNEFVRLLVDRGFGSSYTDSDGTENHCGLDYLMVEEHEDNQFEMFVTETAGDTYLIRRLTEAFADIDNISVNQVPAEPYDAFSHEFA